MVNVLMERLRVLNRCHDRSVLQAAEYLYHRWDFVKEFDDTHRLGWQKKDLLIGKTLSYARENEVRL